MRFSPTQKLRLLIVDDCEPLARGIARQLQHEFKHVKCMTSTTAATYVLKCGKYDLVLSDWDMPDGGGRVILEMSPVPVVIYTANGDFHTPRDKALMTKAAGIVTKPATRQQLLSALRNAPPQVTAGRRRSAK